MQLPLPTIVVHGITASYLWDEYPLPPEIVWSVITAQYERIRMHPDNVRYEAGQPARITPGQIFEVAYKELINELRHNLSRHDDAPVPVYPFSYDWRQPLETAEAELKSFVAEVIERTKLTRHYAESGYSNSPRVNLVGHSMGGMVIAGYLANERGAAPAAKVATLATPFRGSFEAVVKILTGTADLGGTVPSSREREAARVTPGLYYLMPSFADGFEIADGLPKSAFDPAIWQPGVMETIEEYVRLYAVDPGRAADRKRQAADLFAGLLQSAKQHRAKLEKIRLADLGLRPADWLAIVGIGSTTRVRLKIEKGPRGKPFFNLSSSDRRNEWGEGAGTHDGADPRRTGDGTVPFEGAVPAFLPREALVCVTPDDFGYWEVGDRMLTKVAGFHGILPNMDLVHRIIVRHFTGAPDRNENTWGRCAPGVKPSAWTPPLELKPKLAD